MGPVGGELMHIGLTGVSPELATFEYTVNATNTDGEGEEVGLDNGGGRVSVEMCL